ncbi:MAG: MTAP family purine nucleoside phosphorylase [Nitrospirae bacterium]|nr:MTAP family purine nucleoside phosphorylase [Nitrospirota bacterium]
MAISLAVIGGSGAYDFPHNVFGRLRESITLSTPFGSVSPIHIFEFEGLTYSFLSRHGEKGYNLTAPFVNYRANIWALKELGAERIISWTGPGAINERFHPGDYVIPDDVIDFTRNRPNTFYENRGLGFIRQNPVFCPEIREALGKLTGLSDIKTHVGGVYLCTEGPRLETPAEINFFRQVGSDMVGMTLVPEVFLAKELEMCYGSLSYISNYAEGIKTLPYEKGVLFEGTLPSHKKEAVSLAMQEIPSIILKALKEISEKERHCPCKDSMLRYKIRGDVDVDWRNWIK